MKQAKTLNSTWMEYMYACNTLHVVHVTSCMQLEYVHVHKCMCMSACAMYYVHYVHVSETESVTVCTCTSVLINHNVISILFILQLLSLSIEKRQHKETVWRLNFTDNYLPKTVLQRNKWISINKEICIYGREGREREREKEKEREEKERGEREREREREGGG